MTFFESSSRCSSLLEHDLFENRCLTPDQVEGRPFRDHASVAAHAPTDQDKQTSVLVPQAPGEEIAIPFVTTTPPLGEPFSDPLAQAAVPTSFVFVFPVTPMADPLAQPAAHFLPVLKKVYDQIAQIVPRPNPVPQDIAQIAVHIAIAIAPSLR